MERLPIRRGTWDDEERLGALLAVSFAADPFVRWLNPDPLVFLRDSALHPRRAYAPAFEAGTLFVIGDFQGAALWLPPGADTDWSGDAGPEESPPGLPPDFAALMAASALHHPTGPHWYLGLLAVDIAARGKGLGTQLLEHTLALVDRDRLPAYLESTNGTNLTLYRRFGFELLEEVRVGKSPARYPMLRPAQ